MKVTIEGKRLYELVRKAVSEVLTENFKRLKIELIPYADDKEMEEIKAIFGSPKKYKTQKFVRQKL